ncbi:MAG: hypothetical protein VB071_11915 [Lawsonibacter sp.]|nr:hypothetical protein [Lawsonibacter sp.]
MHQAGNHRPFIAARQLQVAVSAFADAENSIYFYESAPRRVEVTMAKHVKRSVIPIYLIGAVWLVYALLFPLRTAAQYVLCAGVSLVAFVVGKAVFPDKAYQIPGEPETKKAETQKAEQKQ